MLVDTKLLQKKKTIYILSSRIFCAVQRVIKRKCMGPGNYKVWEGGGRVMKWEL